MAKTPNKLTAHIVKDTLNYSGSTSPRIEDLPTPHVVARSKQRRLSELASALSFAVDEALKSLDSEERVDDRYPLTIGPDGANDTLVGVAISGKRVLKQIPVAVSTAALSSTAESLPPILVRGERYGVEISDGRAFLSPIASPRSHKTLTRRQWEALERVRPDLPRWASANRSGHVVQMRLSDEFVAAMDEKARELGISRTELVRRAVEAFQPKV